MCILLLKLHSTMSSLSNQRMHSTHRINSMRVGYYDERSFTFSPSFVLHEHSHACMYKAMDRTCTLRALTAHARTKAETPRTCIDGWVPSFTHASHRVCMYTLASYLLLLVVATTTCTCVEHERWWKDGWAEGMGLGGSRNGGHIATREEKPYAYGHARMAPFFFPFLHAVARTASLIVLSHSSFAFLVPSLTENVRTYARRGGRRLARSRDEK